MLSHLPLSTSSSEGDFLLEAGDAVVELDAEGVERHGDHIVLADGEDHVHELSGRIALAQGRPAGQ